MAEPCLVPVLVPPAGVVWRCWPLEPSIGWYAVHPMEPRSIPCLGWGCPYCVQLDHPDRPRWEGYLLCCRGHDHGSLLVLRLPRVVYLHLRDESMDGTDLREWRATVTDAGRYRARPIEWCMDSQADEPVPMYADGQSHLPHVLPWWPLPEDRPDYRQAVYDRVRPLPRPTLEAWRQQRWDRAGVPT